MSDELRLAIVEEAKRIGANPADFATVISYETGGTFDPWQSGPITQWGQHKGFIQMGGPQRTKYGYTEGKSVKELIKASADYLVDNGYKPGMGLMDMYSTINAGAPGKYNASDANNGGAPGTVADKVNTQMGGHRDKAIALLGGQYTPSPPSSPMMNPSTPGITNSSEAAPVDYSWLDNFSPVQKESPQQEYFRTAYQNPDPGGFFSSIPTAVENEWAATNMMDAWSAAYKTDPNFKGPMKQEAFKEYSSIAQFPEEMLNTIANAGSKDEMRETANVLKGQLERENELASAGLGGVAATMLAAMADPVAITAAIATEGTLAPILAAAKFGRVARVTGAAVSAGLGNVSAEAAVDIMDYRKRGVSDYALAFGAGAALAGGYHMFKTRDMALGEKLIRGGNKMAAPGSAGAMQVGDINTGTVGPLSLLDDTSVPRSKFQNARVDVVTMAGRYDAGARWLARLLGEDSVGKDVAGNAINTADAVSVDKAHLYHREVNNLNASLVEPYKMWAADNNKGWFKSNQTWLEFGDHLGQFEPGSPDAASRLATQPDYIKKAVKQLDDFYAKWDNYIHNPGEELGKDMRPLPWGKRENYRPMLADHDNIYKMIDTYGRDRMVKAVAMAMQDVLEGLDQRLANKFASGYFDSLSRSGYGNVDRLNHALLGRDRAELLDFIINDLKWDQSDADVDSLIAKIMQKNKDDETSSNPARGKHRTAINYHYVASWDENGTTVTIPIRDLFSKNQILMAQRYADQVSGHVALARLVGKNPETGEEILNGITTRGEWLNLLKQIEDRMIFNKVPPDKAAATIQRLQYMYDHITGVPRLGAAANSSWAATMRRVSGTMFSTLMQNMGLYQFQEMAHIPAMAGFKAFFKAVPAMRVVMTAKGREKKALIPELMAISGMGDDSILNFTKHHFMEEGFAETTTNRAGRMYDNALGYAKRAVNNMSMFNVANSAAHQTAMLVVAQNFGEMAMKFADKVKPKKVRRVNKITKSKIVDGKVVQETVEEPAFNQIKKPKFKEITEKTVNPNPRQIVKQEEWTDKVLNPKPKKIQKMEEWTDKVLNPNPRKIIKTEQWTEIAIDPVTGKETKSIKNEPVFKDGKPVMIDDPNDEWITTKSMKPVLDKKGKPVMIDDPNDEWITSTVMRDVLDKDGKPVMIDDPADEFLAVEKKMVEDGFDLVDEPAFDTVYDFKVDDINTFFGRKDADRMRMLGFDDKSLAQVLNNIFEHAEFTDGATGKRIVHMNFEKWDPVARARFSKALYSWTGRIIQRNDVGSMAKWMTHPMAGMIFQFRSFVFGAWGKQTLHNLANLDPRTYASMTMQLAGASAMYYLQGRARSLGKEDPDEYMDETILKGRFTDSDLEGIFWGGLGRTGASSILPMVVDTAMPWIGQETLFTNSRSSGMASDLIMGSPFKSTYDSVNATMASVADIIKDGREPSQPELRKAAKLIGVWLPYTIGVDLTIQGFPKFTPKD